jgi:hypothetical protein
MHPFGQVFVHTVYGWDGQSHLTKQLPHDIVSHHKAYNVIRGDINLRVQESMAWAQQEARVRLRSVSFRDTCHTAKGGWTDIDHDLISPAVCTQVVQAHSMEDTIPTHRPITLHIARRHQG